MSNQEKAEYIDNFLKKLFDADFPSSLASLLESQEIPSQQNEANFKLLEFELEKYNLVNLVRGRDNTTFGGQCEYLINGKGIDYVLRGRSTLELFEGNAHEDKISSNTSGKFGRINVNEFRTMQINPKIFISYAWESDDLKDWVKNLAFELRNNGIDAKLDQWEVIPGDQMPHFMEKSVRENDYVLIICTPIYKLRSENRIGGVGYEGDIMTAEVLQNSNHRKFIPLLQSGDKDTSIPSWLKGKYFIDLSNDTHFEKNFEDLITTVFNSREVAPKLGQIPTRFQNQVITAIKRQQSEQDDKIKIKGIIVDEVTQPINDGSSGSALYKIPFELNNFPSYAWIDFFIQSYNHPPNFTLMHRPGIASVSGNKIYLDGTTIEEVEEYHKKTLKLAVDAANNKFAELQASIKYLEEQEKIRKEQYAKNINDINKRINFDD